MEISKELVYENFGCPIDVLKLIFKPNNKPSENEVTVKWLLSPINPADIACIQGNWPIKPNLPVCPGNDGVGEIIAIGSEIKDLKIGDRVLSNGSNLGTWRTLANYQRSQVMLVSKDISLEAASILKVNPCTAYRMLKDYVKLKAGDTVIQNGSNSVVGQMIIQLCSLWNCRTVNIIRNRSDINQVKEELLNLGADEILSEEELESTNIFKDNIMQRPKLALDCVGGMSTLKLMDLLDNDGVIVCYGSMSKKDMVISGYNLRFKNLTVRSFWLTDWTKRNTTSKEREQMFRDLTEMFKNKKLMLPKLKRIFIEDYKNAFLQSVNSEGHSIAKCVFDMTNNNLV